MFAEFQFGDLSAAINALCLALVFLCLREAKEAHASLNVVKRRTARIRKEQKEVKDELKETCKAVKEQNGSSPPAKPCDKPPEGKPS